MTTQDRTLLMVVVAVAVAAASWFLLVKPERQKAAQLTTQLEQAQSATDAAVADAAAASAARRRYAEDYASVVKLGKAVPTDDDVASLVYQLDTSAKQAGVDFRAVAVSEPTPSATPASPAPQNSAGAQKGTTPTQAPAAASGTSLPGDVTTVPITMTFEGGYFQMTNFLGKIERYAKAGEEDIAVRGRLVSIESINVTTGSGGFPQIKAEVTANAYRAPLPAVQGAETPAAQPASGAGTPGSGATSASSGAGAVAKTAVIGAPR